MPYIRTLNAKTIIDEIGLFIGATLLITPLIFFLLFSVRLGSGIHDRCNHWRNVVVRNHGRNGLRNYSTIHWLTLVS
jgi:hypothetical protein